MDDTTRTDGTADSADDVEAHGIKETAAVGITAATLAAGAGAASAHAAKSPGVHQASAHADVLKKGAPSAHAKRAHSSIYKFFSRSWSRSTAVNKHDKT
jgi:hypothetical protein